MQNRLLQQRWGTETQKICVFCTIRRDSLLSAVFIGADSVFRLERTVKIRIVLESAAVADRSGRCPLGKHLLCHKQSFVESPPELELPLVPVLGEIEELPLFDL